MPFAFAGTTYVLLAIALVVRGAGLSAVNLAVVLQNQLTGHTARTAYAHSFTARSRAP